MLNIYGTTKMNKLHLAIELCFGKEVKSTAHLNVENIDILFKDGSTLLTTYKHLCDAFAGTIIELDTQLNVDFSQISPIKQ